MSRGHRLDANLIESWRDFEIDPATVEKYINEFNKIGCTSFIINNNILEEFNMPKLNGKEVNNNFSPIREENEHFDNVNKPKHYNREGAMECFDEFVLIYGKEAAKHACLFNIHKYRYRAADKNGEEDLRKSDWYLNKYKELSESKVTIDGSSYYMPKNSIALYSDNPFQE